ncbi:MAG TPA: SGNH/GDSL hydrolase family protein [Candidatus Binatia bacterium]
MRAKLASITILACVAVASATAHAQSLQPGQRPPTRMLAIGDSITRAFDATLPADNLSQSWSSGYRGFLERLLNLPNVKSHNQRISANFGDSGRRNIVVARNGARVRSLVDQARQARWRGITYATVLLGGNDVCRDSIEDIPTDEEFANDVIAGLLELFNALPKGATVQVVAIPDIKRLYDIGIDKTVLGIVDCEFLWRFTALGFP